MRPAPKSAFVRHVLTLDFWDDEPDDDFATSEFERVASMIEDGFTSGEIVGDNGERGWWDLSRVYPDDAAPSAALLAALQGMMALPVNQSWSPAEIAARDRAKAALLSAGISL